VSKKIIETISEMVAHTAIRKSRAAKSRFEPKRSQAEDSRGVYLSSCAAIAEHFAPLGFKYAKSCQHFTNQKDDLTCRVSFQSSHNNTSGEYVALWIHANVGSKRLKKWRARQSNPLAHRDALAGGQIGNLLEKPSWYEWNLASSSEREIVIRDAISTIENIALPYFSQFEDVAALAKRLEFGAVPSLDVGNAIEFLLCHNFKPSAIAHARWFLNAHSNIMPQYLELVEKFRVAGIPDVRTLSYAERLALVTVTYGLSL